MAAADFVCAGCGAPAGTLPFRCPARGAGDDVDHVLVRAPLAPGDLHAAGDHPNPFVRWRRALYAYEVGRRGGLDDAAIVARLEALDAAVEAAGGRGFRVTPCFAAEGLAEAFGGAAIWVKDETGNVAGSHKARHLMGVALTLDLLAATGQGDPASAAAPFAIASCGNAALAASVVAQAAGRPLQVFIPPDANPKVVEELRARGARIAVCERRPGQDGDPCYHAFVAAVAGGALPFCCQGPDNGLTVEGGQTLAWELVAALAEAGVTLDDLYVQVGGGALASAVARGLAQAHAAGLLSALPRLHAVQTEGCWPLIRAWERVTARAFEALGRPLPDAWPERAAILADAPAAAEDALAYARAHRAAFMAPWATPPRSLAYGILDDETYDWHAVVAGMLATGGWPVIIADPDIVAAVDLARDRVGVPACTTGAAGLAGALVDQRAHGARLGARRGVILSGVQR